MNTELKFSKIDKTINEDSVTRIHFKDIIYRLPIVGKFVKLDDSKELIAKRMSRFVTTGKSENFIITGSKQFTLILNVEDIRDIVII